MGICSILGRLRIPGRDGHFLNRFLPMEGYTQARCKNLKIYCREWNFTARFDNQMTFLRIFAILIRNLLLSSKIYCHQVPRIPDFCNRARRGVYFPFFRGGFWFRVVLGVDYKILGANLGKIYFFAEKVIWWIVVAENMALKGELECNFSVWGGKGCSLAGVPQKVRRWHLGWEPSTDVPQNIPEFQSYLS